MKETKLIEFLKFMETKFIENFGNDKDVPVFSEVCELFFKKEEPTMVRTAKKVVGHLNKKYGYNGFKPLEIGTPVYEEVDRYYFELYPETGNKPPIKLRFYKETLKKHINFN